jgi:hypothetical protein
VVKSFRHFRPKKNQLQIVEPSILRAVTLFLGKKNYPTSAASNASVYSTGLTD